MSRKMLVIGLDSAPPELVFHRFFDDLPNIRSLLDSGLYGELNSTIPPITVPAWMSMMTGKDPGTLGFYGLRNRVDRSYSRMAIANSRLVRDDTLWDVLSRAGRGVILVGVPQTFPPKPVNGCMVTSFLTPDTASAYTHPPELKSEVEHVSGGYILDVPDFRTSDRERLLRQIYDMTEKRFRVTRHLMQTRPWDFLMHVEMGTDRIHHGFWRYLDEAHRLHEPGSEFRQAIRDYYRYLDSEIGRLIDVAGENTSVLLVSDHGAKRIDGCICVNEWLIREGYLSLKSTPDVPRELDELEVDWERTVAWGAGGYYARIFLNVVGREPQGAVPPEDCGAVRDEVARKLAAIPDPQGRPLSTRVFKPEDVYRTCNGVPPDLIVYFGDLLWRSNGSVGRGDIYSLESDTGPDDANHDQQGVIALRTPDLEGGERLQGADILDVAPTVLDLMDLPIPADMQGRSLLTQSSGTETGQTIEGGEPDSAEVYSQEEQEAVEKRLRALGYL